MLRRHAAGQILNSNIYSDFLNSKGTRALTFENLNRCCDAMLQAKSAVSSDGATNRACAKEQERSEEAEEFKFSKSARDAGGVNAGAHEANMLAAGCVRNVLRQLGLERYADTLHNANVHDLRSLARLTEGEMRQLGLSVGARKRLLSEQTALRSRVHPVGGNVGAVSARANKFGTSADNGAVDDAEVARAVAVTEAAKAGRTDGAVQTKGQRLKKVGQEIRDAMPERKEAKGHRKQLMLTGSRKDGSKLAGERGDGSEGCSQVALALALSASLEGQMSEHMRRRREVARNLAEVCLCGEAEKSEVQLLLLEFMPPQSQDAGAPTGRAAGVDRNGVSLIQQNISLPHSLLSRGLSDVREDDNKGGGCQSLWKLSALGAPECEEQVGLFYNGLLGRRSLSQLESRPHVFDTYGAQPSGDKSDEDGTIFDNEVGSCAADSLPCEAQEVYAALPLHLASRCNFSAAAQDCDSVLESSAAGVESSSAVEPGHQEVLAGDEHGSPVDRVDRPGASMGGCKVGDAEERSQVYRQTSCIRDAAADTTITGGCQGPDSALLSRLSAPRKIDDVFGTCKLSGTPYLLAPSLPAVHPQEISPLLQQGPQQGDEDESEFFVPDSEDEDAEYQARVPAMRPGVRCAMTTSEEAGLSQSVAGGTSRGGVEAGEAQDKGMLSQLLMHMSDSEDEGGDEEVGGAAASCRAEANEETGLVTCHGTLHAAGVLERGGAQGEEGGGGIGSFSEVLSLVHRKLRDMSPQKRAAAKSAMERALGAAVEVVRVCVVCACVRMVMGMSCVACCYAKCDEYPSSGTKECARALRRESVQEFAASRAQIVAKAEEEIAQVRGRMQRDLEAEDVLHSARLHAAVIATFCDLRKVVPVGKGASARSENDARRPSTLEHPEHGP
jgi:hypothetical protein